MQAIYDKIGLFYTLGRQTDPKLANFLHAHLKDAENILNIGAGTGSYEPEGVDLVAVEPSLTMIQQRPKGSASVIKPQQNHCRLQINLFRIL